MCEHAGGVLRDFIVVIHRDICREHSLIGRPNCLMTEAANSLSAAAGAEFRHLGINRQSIFGLGHGRTRLGSGLRAVAPRCLSRENAGRMMTVLHHTLCGDDFHQTPVSIIFIGENVQSFFFFFFFFVGDATQVLRIRIHMTASTGGTHW